MNRLNRWYTLLALAFLSVSIPAACGKTMNATGIMREEAMAGRADKGMMKDEGMSEDKGMMKDEGMSEDKAMMKDEGMSEDKGMMKDEGMSGDKGMMEQDDQMDKMK